MCAELLINYSLPQKWCVFDMIFQSTDIIAKRTAVLRGLPLILGDDNMDFFKICFVSQLCTVIFSGCLVFFVIEIQDDIWYVILLLLSGLRRPRSFSNHDWDPDHHPWGQTSLPWLAAPPALRYCNHFGRKNRRRWPSKSSTCHVHALRTYLHSEFGVPSTTEAHLWLYPKGASLTWT